MSDKEINITYETLFEFSQREKNREELQSLGDNFYEDVSHYIQEKIKILQKDQGTLDTFSEEEKEKTRTQLGNIKRILTQLYEKREKKIINMATHKSREPATLVDESVMLNHESEMYNHFTDLLNKYRKEKLMSLLSTKPAQPTQPTQESTEQTQEPTQPTQESTEQTQEQTQESTEQTQQTQEQTQESTPVKEEEKPLQETESPETHLQQESTQESIKQTEQTQEQTEIAKSKQETSDTQETQEKETKRIKFTHYVPKFLGREMEVYGPFEPEDIATLPIELAKILITKGRAEEI